MYLGDAKHVIKHSWRLHTLGIALTTTLVDSKSHRAKNRIRKMHLEFIGEHEIYRRPGSKLAGIEGTRETYHFMGANTPKNDAATTTVKVMTERRCCKEVDAEKPASGEEEAVVRKVKKRYRVRTRLASCFCSQCQISRYGEYHINRTYPALVPEMMDGEVNKMVIMDTGVFPVGVDEI